MCFTHPLLRTQSHLSILFYIRSRGVKNPTSSFTEPRLNKSINNIISRGPDRVERNPLLYLHAVDEVIENSLVKSDKIMWEKLRRPNAVDFAEINAIAKKTILKNNWTKNKSVFLINIRVLN